MFVFPQNSYVEVLTFKMMVLGGVWPLEGELDHPSGWRPYDRVSIFIKKTPERESMRERDPAPTSLVT